MMPPCRLVLVCLLILSLPSFAQGTTGQPVVGVDERVLEAFAFYDRAKSNFQRDDFVAAAVEFQQAYALFVALARDDRGRIADPKMRLHARVALSQSATSFSRAQMAVEAYDAFHILNEEFTAEVDEGTQTLEVQNAMAKLQERIGTAVLLGLPAGAEVRIDGRLLKREEQEKPVRLSAGQRTMEVRAPFYKPYLQSFAVTGKQQVELTVEMELSTLPTQLRLESSVEPAAVELDDKSVGNAPIELIIQPGQHRYRVTSESYREAQGTFSAVPGQRTVVEVGLLPQRAPLGLRIETGYVFTSPLRGGTPLNPSATDDNPTPPGVEPTSGATLRTFYAFERMRNIRLGLTLEIQARTINPGAFGTIALWCPDATSWGNGQAGWCPVQFEPRLNLPGSRVGPFSSGDYSLRVGTRLERRFGLFSFQFSTGLTAESYRRNSIVGLSLWVAWFSASTGIDL